MDYSYENQNSLDQEIQKVSLIEGDQISSKVQQISNFEETYKILDCIVNGESGEKQKISDNDSSFDFSPPDLSKYAENQTQTEETIFYLKLQIKKLQADLEKEKHKSQKFLEIASKYIENCKIQKFDYDLLYQEKEKIENELNTLKEIQIKDTRLQKQLQVNQRVKLNYDTQFQQQVGQCQRIIGNLKKQQQSDVIVKQKSHPNSHITQLKQNNQVSQGGRLLIKKTSFQIRNEVNKQNQKQNQHSKLQKK